MICQMNLIVFSQPRQLLMKVSFIFCDFLKNLTNCFVKKKETSHLSLVIDGFDQGKNVFNCNGSGLKTTAFHHQIASSSSSNGGFNIIPSTQVPGCIYVPVRVINSGLANNKNQLVDGGGGSSNSNASNHYGNQNNLTNLYASSVAVRVLNCFFELLFNSLLYLSV